MNITRRGLFSGALGALLAPVVAKWPALEFCIPGRTYIFYSGYEVLDIGQDDMLGSVEFDWSSVPLRHVEIKS